MFSEESLHDECGAYLSSIQQAANYRPHFQLPLYFNPGMTVLNKNNYPPLNWL